VNEEGGVKVEISLEYIGSQNAFELVMMGFSCRYCSGDMCGKTGEEFERGVACRRLPGFDRASICAVDLHALPPRAHPSAWPA